MKVIILAGGKGTRLLPLTEHIPKTLAPVSGIPIIDRIFQSLPDTIDQVILVVDYLKEHIANHVGKSFHGYPVTHIQQGDIRGTFGALLSAKHLLDLDERFLILNGDDIHDKSELEKYLEYPRSFGLQKMHMTNYYHISCDPYGFVDSFQLQTPEEKKYGTFVATGAYVLDGHIFEHTGIKLRDGEYGLPQTILAQKDIFPIKGIVTTRWLPINSFDDLEKAEKILKLND